MANQLPDPHISQELLQYLDRIYPDKCASFSEDIERIRYKSGQRSVYEHLKTVYEKQNKNILT
jgi:hypothetical protein